MNIEEMEGKNEVEVKSKDVNVVSLFEPTQKLDEDCVNVSAPPNTITVLSSPGIFKGMELEETFYVQTTDCTTDGANLTPEMTKQQCENYSSERTEQELDIILSSNLMLMNTEETERKNEIEMKNTNVEVVNVFESSPQSSYNNVSDPRNSITNVNKDLELEDTFETLTTDYSNQPLNTELECKSDPLERAENDFSNILSPMLISIEEVERKPKNTGNSHLSEPSEKFYPNCENLSVSQHYLAVNSPPVLKVFELEESTQNITDCTQRPEKNEIQCRSDNFELSYIPKSDQHTPLQSRQNSVQTGETDYEDSFYNATGTRSNTESFSELRFSISETHSEFNYSESDDETSPEVTMPRNTEEFNLLEQFPDICNYQAKTVDDTSGILYEMSEHLNKVPKLLSEFNKQSSNPERVSPSELKLEESIAFKNDTGDTLEDRVLRYFSQCDKLPLTWKENSKGQEELEKLEAAVERMLTQVEIQENLLKEDMDFVPLVLDKNEVKALPMLVDTLCISPQVQRRQIHAIPPIKTDDSKLLSSKYTNFVFSIPPNIESSSVIEKKHEPFVEKDIPSCSINDLEKSVNRLLNEVEKEEEKLRMSSPDSRQTYTSTTSTTDVSSEDDSFGVWWEGAYRSLPRHSARKRLTKSSVCTQKLLKPPQKSFCSQSQTSDDSDTSKESVRFSDKPKKQPQSKLVVRTTESGKSALEIRTCNDFVENTKEEGDSKFSRMFSRTRSEARSIWNRSLPSLRHSPPLFPSIIPRSLGSDDSINYVKYMEPSDCIQYFTPCPSMDLDSTGYCTWSQKCSGGKALIDSYRLCLAF